VYLAASIAKILEYMVLNTSETLAGSVTIVSRGGWLRWIYGSGLPRQ
jgi:hypothetical protein